MQISYHKVAAIPSLWSDTVSWIFSEVPPLIDLINHVKNNSRLGSNILVRFSKNKITKN